MLNFWFVCLGVMYTMLLVSVVCPFLITPSIFSNVNLFVCFCSVLFCFVCFFVVFFFFCLLIDFIFFCFDLFLVVEIINYQREIFQK